MMTTTIEAIMSLRPNAQWTMREGEELEWNDTDQTQPSEKEISDEVERMQAKYDSLEYSRERKAKYDALNQYEMQFDDQRDGTTTWVDAINAIKSTYPKT